MPSNESIASIVKQIPYKVLILGGSYAGLGAALNLQDLCSGRKARFAAQAPDTSRFGKIPVEITVVDEKDGYFHLISTPLAHASSEFAPRAWTKFRDLPALKNIRFIQGTAENVDCSKRHAVILDAETKSPVTLEYDYLVAATGLRRVWPVVPQAKSRESYLSEAAEHIEAVRKAKNGVAVIGGGAVGIEMAAEIKLVMPDQKVTLIHSRDKLCSSEPLPDEFKDRCLATLHEAGVETIMGQRVLGVETFQSEEGDAISELTLADNSTLRAGYVIHAISRSIPSTTYLPASARDNEGYVKVTPRLHLTSDMPNALNHFAIGDIAKWSGIKRCGAAMHMGQYAAQNIHQLMLVEQEGIKPEFLELQEIPPMIGIAIGKQAVAYWPADGVTYGESVQEMCFGNDLGYTICWNHMQLGDECPS
ncbi:hypothetical protein PV08_02210 [Exophiala spinifera]|uniref:FAD/NAD(P)-binding domain-containing protein n=1 Tax=Exophiala spinifera TaxID=91928 RepID=A0A0D2BT95_9EURO|nr:uncharacterized protein PV08_02210 [Exophiala spinifera]KIW21630.1 hypothetical protein PV08_02210 [Exophiala spinifera]